MADGRWYAIECIKGPIDLEGRVVPEDGTFSLGVVEIGGFIKDFGGIGEDKEAVGETFWDPKELEFVCG